MPYLMDLTWNKSQENLWLQAGVFGFNALVDTIRWGIYNGRVKQAGCEICERGGPGPDHFGSSLCKSHSIASGGFRSHCSCDFCF